MTAFAAVAPPEPTLIPSEMIRHAEALVPGLRQRQQQTEDAGQLHPENHEVFMNAGLIASSSRAASEVTNSTCLPSWAP
jgi:hypothetical protein